MKYRIFIFRVQDEFAVERRGLTECRRRKGSLRPMRMSSSSPSKIEGVPRQRRGSMMSGGFKPEHVGQFGFYMEAIDWHGDAEWAEGMRYLFDDAKEKIGDVQKAIACFMRGAQLGNANCMRQLASCYESGCGVTQDLSKAREWRAKALGII